MNGLYQADILGAMKRRLKAIVVFLLAWQVKRLYRKNKFITIAVAGSYGKTSTKLAIAQVLGIQYRVRFQNGNYNDISTVPLIFFGHDAPSLFNPFSWAGVFLKNELALLQKYKYDVVVVELGTDGPGQIREFKKYLKADLSLVTAIAPEHMEFFSGIDEVAEEEFAVQDFSKLVLVNGNLCPKTILPNNKAKVLPYKVTFNEQDLAEEWSVETEKSKSTSLNIKPLSISQLYSFASAAIVAERMGIPIEDIKKALKKIKAVPGRMNRLDGKNGSQIIDDTYNASPEATVMALNTLYAHPAGKRIALLGNMNELGSQSEKYHRAVGKKCNPAKLDLVVTLGPDANKFLAEEAKKQGCKVLQADTPYQAAKIIEKSLSENVVVLAKGSQNGVYAEEAVKLLLADQEDAGLLVRQTEEWLRKKQKSFDN
jgi:UDP-N-acetylmuramyl pentapeptide synthase